MKLNEMPGMDRGGTADDVALAVQWGINAVMDLFPATAFGNYPSRLPRQLCHPSGHSSPVPGLALSSGHPSETVLKRDRQAFAVFLDLTKWFIYNISLRSYSGVTPGVEPPTSGDAI